MSSLGVDISNIYSFTEPHLSWPERGQGERPEVDYTQKVTRLVHKLLKNTKYFPLYLPGFPEDFSQKILSGQPFSFPYATKVFTGWV